MKRINANQYQNTLARRVDDASTRRKRLQAEEARYTLVLHAARKKLALSLHEYCLADTIHKLSGNRSRVPGWCYASKEQLADGLGLTRRGVQKLISSLIVKEIVERDEDTNYLRTTELWWRETEVIKNRYFSR